MENDKNKSGDPVKKTLNNEGYISRKGITSEEIEQFEEGQGKFEKANKSDIAEDQISTSNMDPSSNDKGNLVVQQSTLTDEEKIRYDLEAEKVKAGGDIGEGRSQGSDRA